MIGHDLQNTIDAVTRWLAWRDSTRAARTEIVGADRADDIISAPQGDAQPVAWRHLGETGFKYTTLERVAEIWSDQGCTVTPLYAHPSTAPEAGDLAPEATEACAEQTEIVIKAMQAAAREIDPRFAGHHENIGFAIRRLRNLTQSFLDACRSNDALRQQLGTDARTGDTPTGPGTGYASDAKTCAADAALMQVKGGDLISMDATGPWRMALENAARMAEQGVLSMDGGQAAVEIRALAPDRAAPPVSAGTVKPLVWSGTEGRGSCAAYRLERPHGGSWIIYSEGAVLGGVLHGAYRQVYQSVEAAKAAAQADYAARILSAIEMPVSAWQGTQAAIDVLAERQRQISEEGFTDRADDAYQARDLASAAACYAFAAAGYLMAHDGEPPKWWPWAKSWWKPNAGNPRRDLVKSGALILAEIERLDRAAPPSDAKGAVND